MSDVATVSITKEEAQSLTDRIKSAVEHTWGLIKQAYESRAWAALGYESWDDYCGKEFGTSRLAIPREERREVVQSFRDAGMSIRAIASAIGKNHQTVHNDLTDNERIKSVQAEMLEGESEPEVVTPTIIGVDGKKYSAKAKPVEQNDYPVTISETSTMPPAPLVPQFRDVCDQLMKLSDQLVNLTCDQRYDISKVGIADECARDFGKVVERIEDLLDNLAAEE